MWLHEILLQLPVWEVSATHVELGTLTGHTHSYKLFKGIY